MDVEQVFLFFVFFLYLLQLHSSGLLGAPKAQDEMESDKYLPELMAEKDTLDPSFQHSLRLLDQGRLNVRGKTLK